MTPAQCRAARALLDWPPGRLAEAAMLDVALVEQFEAGAAIPHPAFAAVQRALEDAEVCFTGETGVRIGTPVPVETPAEAPAPRLREIGPESEVRGGHEAPDGGLR